MMNSIKKRWLAAIAAAALLAGAFFIGIGIGKVMTNLRFRDTYRNSEVSWRQDLAHGLVGEEVRDKRNQELADNMQYVSIERVLHFSSGHAEAEANIAVDGQSDFGCTVTIVRDATGEPLYQSGIIDPGKYIEKIRLGTALRKGYYPCTVVWSYYTEGDEYIGETAWKAVVIVGE